MHVHGFEPEVVVLINCDELRPIEIRFQTALAPSLNYWHLRDPNDALVEIGIDPSNGAVVEITAVLLPELSTDLALPLYSDDRISRGLPHVDLSAWMNGESYVDESMKVTAYLIRNRFILVFGECIQTFVNSVRCDRVVFLIDQLQQLRGIEVLDLTQDEISSIRYAVYGQWEHWPRGSVWRTP